jgi:hypothetical protein
VLSKRAKTKTKVNCQLTYSLLWIPKKSWEKHQAGQIGFISEGQQDEKAPHLAVICDNPNDPNYGTAYRSDCIPSGSVPFCPNCNSYVSATTTRNEFDGVESAVCDCCGTMLWHD